MTKHVQAFFKTENDAEDVKSHLQTLKVDDARVDTLPDADNKMILTPLAFSGNNAHGMGAGGGIVATFDAKDGTPVDDSPRPNSLEFSVADDDYQEALKIIMENDGHVSKEIYDKNK